MISFIYTKKENTDFKFMWMLAQLANEYKFTIQFVSLSCCRLYISSKQTGDMRIKWGVEWECLKLCYNR